jgi:1-acyl-sn-glycerol-3-phosphate acyltransferase
MTNERRSARADTPRPIHPVRRTIRYWLSRTLAATIARGWLRLEFDGRERLPDGPAIYAFNHLSWADPFVLMATLPYRPRLSFFGPREEDMRTSGRNRLLLWTGSTIPYKPGKGDLIEATRKVSAVLAEGGVVGIAAEGRIGAMEGRLLPLNEGAAYFALRSHVPLVPIAVSGTSWLGFGARVHIQAGEPIVSDRRPDRAGIQAATEELRVRLQGLLDGAAEPDRTGRVARWVTDKFNEWPEGSYDAALAAQRDDGHAKIAPPAESDGLAYSAAIQQPKE